MRRTCLLVLLALLAGCASPASTPTPIPPAASATQAALAPTAALPVATQPPVPSVVSSQPAATEAVPAGDFENPVLKSNFPDPFLLQEGGTWYAYATNGSGRNVQLATSTDLVNWKLDGDAMPALPAWVKLSRPDVWAPEVIKIGQQFILYYTARDDESGKQCVGVAVSDQPRGSFRDTRDRPLVCQVAEGGTIDASPFRDGDKLYLYYKNDGNCCGLPTYIYAQELAPDGLSLVGEAMRLERNDAPWEGRVVEAPTMVKQDGKYFLFYSANNFAGVEYAVGYAACQTATGPCQDAPENPILTSQMDRRPFVVGPGHQTVIEMDGQDWIVYHAWQVLPSGLRGETRQMWIDRLDWPGGKPDVEGPTTGPQPAP